MRMLFTPEESAGRKAAAGNKTSLSIGSGYRPRRERHDRNREETPPTNEAVASGSDATKRLSWCCGDMLHSPHIDGLTIASRAALAANELV